MASGGAHREVQHNGDSREVVYIWRHAKGPRRCSWRCQRRTTHGYQPATSSARLLWSHDSPHVAPARSAYILCELSSPIPSGPARTMDCGLRGKRGTQPWEPHCRSMSCDRPRVPLRKQGEEVMYHCSRCASSHSAPTATHNASAVTRRTGLIFPPLSYRIYMFLSQDLALPDRAALLGRSTAHMHLLTLALVLGYRFWLHVVRGRRVGSLGGAGGQSRPWY